MSERERRIEKIRYRNELLSDPDFVRRARAAQLHSAKGVAVVVVGLFALTGLLYAVTNWI